MNKVCSQLLQRDVTDIGTRVHPPHAQFFKLCGFSLDKYNSVLMILESEAMIRRDANQLHSTLPDRLEMDRKLMLAVTKPSMTRKLQAYVTLDTYSTGESE